jgi:DNA-binding response OmpR family regulator
MQRFRAAAATVALVSPDQATIDEVVSLLADDTTRVETSRTFDELLDSMTTLVPDVVIIDDVIELDATQTIRLLRRRQPLVHIVYMNTREERRTIELLQCGADDAIFAGSPILMARLQAATRRARTMNAGSRIAIGDIVHDRESRRVWCAGREVELTPHEYGVVDCLFWHTPKPVGIDTLSDFVWGDTPETKRRSLVQVYISYVRKKLSKSKQVAISFARGSGYEFTPRVDDE